MRNKQCYPSCQKSTQKEMTLDATTVIRTISGLLFIVVLFFVLIPPYWMIFKKAGFSPWLSLLMLIPLVNIILLYVVGFSDWKTAPAFRGLPQGPPEPGD